MKTQKTIYHLIVDRSGSMSNCIENTITGFNEQITHIRRLEEQYPEQEFTIGLTLFNDHVKHLHFQSSPNAAPLLTNESYRPMAAPHCWMPLVQPHYFSRQPKKNQPDASPQRSWW